MRKRDIDLGLTREIKAQNAAQKNAGYSYFISGDVSSGYRFALVNRYGNELFESPIFLNKEACRRGLRTAQRHGACTDIRDDTR